MENIIYERKRRIKKLNDEFNEILSLFKKINNMGYVKNVKNGFEGSGYTFEKLIGKEEDHESKPDYKNIEIKTTRLKRKKEITLINITPDISNKDNEFPMEEILKKIGYPDKSNKKYKKINSFIFGDKWNYIGLYTYKRIKLDVNYEDKKIYINAFEYNNEEIKIGASWSFNFIKKRVEKKLKNLALINVDTKRINGEEYSYYKNIELYKIISTDLFIDLIKEGIIIVELRANIIKEGVYKGKIKSRGANFIIDYKNIEKLYNKIY